MLESLSMILYNVNMDEILLRKIAIMRNILLFLFQDLWQMGLIGDQFLMESWWFAGDKCDMDEETR